MTFTVTVPPAAATSNAFCSTTIPSVAAWVTWTVPVDVDPSLPVPVIVKFVLRSS